MPRPRSTRNCVILGATGRLGRILANNRGVFQARGIRLLYQTRQAIPALGSEDWLVWNPGKGPDRGAAAFQAALAPFGGAEAIINLAGVVPGQGGDLADNTRLALAALAAGRAVGARLLLLASSAAVYGDASGILDEETPPAPQSDYGRAKLAMERAMAEAGAGGVADGINTCCLRISNVAGADQLLQNAARAAPNRPMRLGRFRNGLSPCRSYIGPETLARVLATLLAAGLAGQTLPPCLNVAAPQPVFMADLLTALAEKRPLAWEFCDAGAALPRVELDTTRLARFHRFAAADSQPGEIIRQVLAQ